MTCVLGSYVRTFYVRTNATVSLRVPLYLPLQHDLVSARMSVPALLHASQTACLGSLTNSGIECWSARLAGLEINGIFDHELCRRIQVCRAGINPQPLNLDIVVDDGFVIDCP
jgi:hypothetical protein